MEDSSSELIPRDTSTDIFFHIATKLSDRELLLLFPIFEKQIRSLLNNNEFWYRRSEYLVKRNLLERQGVEWRKIYRTLYLTREDENNIVDSVYQWKHLDYIPSISVLVEVFGPLDWEEYEQEDIWEQVHTPEVLTHLLKIGYLEDKLEYEAEALKASSKNGRLEMVIHLLEMINKSLEQDDSDEELVIDDLREIIYGAAMLAAREKHNKIFKYIVEATEDICSEPKIFMGAAIEGQNKSLIRYVSKIYGEGILFELAITEDSILALEVMLELQDDATFKESVFIDALRQGSVNIVRYLLEEKIISEENLDWEDMLRDSAIRRYHPDLTEYILSRMKVIPSDILLESSSGNPDIFEKIVSHPGADIISNLSQIIKRIARSPEYIREQNAKILARDPRLKVEDMSYSDFIALLDIIDSPNKMRMIENEILSDYTGRPRYRSEDQLMKIIRLELEEDTIYALILRYILLKRPTSLELVDWMIEQKNRSIMEAGRCIAENELPTSEEVIPIRALLLCTLHPKMQVEQQISYLEEEGFTRDDIVRSVRLISTFLRMKR